MSLCCSFFFSSRRRHTRCYRDWSSDVCSSDLFGFIGELQGEHFLLGAARCGHTHELEKATNAMFEVHDEVAVVEFAEIDLRSEERRVGKECRYRWWRYRLKQQHESNSVW